MQHDGFWSARTLRSAGEPWVSPEAIEKLRRRLGQSSSTPDPHASGPWFHYYRDAADEEPGDGALRFAREKLGLRHPRTGGLQMWRFQRDLIRAVYRHKRVAVTSSRSTGKTHALGHLCATFLFQEPSRILVISPTMRQAQKGVMGEARAAIVNSPERLQLETNNASEMRIDERHWCLALPSRDPDTMRGFHASPAVPGDPDANGLSKDDVEWLAEQGNDDATRLLVIVDEAAGVNTEAFRVLEGMLTKPNVYFVMTGNPTLGADEEHEYVRAFKEGSSWHRMRVSSVDPVKFPAPSGVMYDAVYHPVPHYLVQPSDVQSALAQYDADDPILIADWAGTFPSGSTDWNVVPRAALEGALATNGANLRPLGPRMGVDIGTGNPDMCVASLFVDGEKRCDHRFAPSSDDKEGQVTIATTIMALAAKWGAEIAGRGPGGSEWDGSPIPGERISIDDSGLVGVGDILASRGCLVDKVNFARGPAGQWRDLTGTQRCLNSRTEMHWVARRGLQEGVFVIPRQFSRSWSEATWTHYERSWDSKGPVIKLEPKEKVVKRHGHSPDTFDADILAMRAPALSKIIRQEGAPVVSPHSGQPIRKGRLRPTKLKGGRRIG